MSREGDQMTPTRAYEALVIFRTAGTEQDMARAAAHVEEPIKKLGGRVETSQPMGRRRLAFRIAKHAEGYYYLLRFALPTSQVEELERLLRLNESIVRFMILNAEEVPLPAAAARPSGSPQGATVSARAS